MKTMETIYEEMKALYAAESGTVPRDGGDLELRLYTAAAQLYALWEQAAFVSRQSFPQTAVGEALDHHAQVRGLSRRPGTHAVGTLRFSLAQAAARDIAVPAGTTCTDAAGTAFVTTQAGTVPAGELYCDVPARAEAPGTAGNVPADTVTYMVLAPSGVAACTNPAAFADGSGAESDEELRLRVLGSYRRLPNGANKAYYEAEALSVPGVAGVSVLPRNRGVGTVDVVIASKAGMPSQSLLEAVQEKLEVQREICVDLQVLSPKTKKLNVNLTITPAQGYDGDAVIQAVKDAMAEFFGGHLLGKTVYRSEMGHILYNIPGVANYNITYPSADIKVPADTMAIMNTLYVTKAV